MAAAIGVPKRAEKQALIPHIIIILVSLSSKCNILAIKLPKEPPTCRAAPSRPAEPPQRCVSQGAIKRHNQHRLKETHGTGPVVRQAGSMGACSSPSRIFKGKGMAGHMGAENVTVQNLVIVKIDAENNLIAIKGAIPGPKGGVVCITDAVKKA